ncbi:MAG: SPOR domain-containing protein [Saprospiraceae bacterium]|nr:SPOR domain-containing protein [Saprospiraceae bacterium]
MTSRYRTVFILIAVIVGFFATSHIFYNGMEQIQQWNDEAHQFSEAEALALEPQFSFTDSTSALFKTLFSNDPGAPSVDGPYLVLAGSFATKSRAKKHLLRIEKLGFDEAEILYFKGKKEIYAIGVGAYRELSAAEQHVRSLAERHGLDAYVHKIRKVSRT